MKRANILLAILSLTTIFILFTIAAQAGGPIGKSIYKKNWHGKHGHWDHGLVYGSPVFYVAKARNGRGIGYIGRGVTSRIAKKRAVMKCRYDSLFPGSCHIYRITRVWR